MTTKEYYAKHKEIIKQSVKDYYKQHQEERLQYAKEYRVKPEVKNNSREWAKQYRQTLQYKESKKKSDKKYYENNKEKLIKKITKWKKTSPRYKKWLIKYKSKKSNYFKEYHKKWREQNRERIKEYRDKNKEKLRKQEREWREKNKDIILEKQKIYRESNKDKIKERRLKNRDKDKQYRERNKERLKKAKKDYYHKTKPIRIKYITEWRKNNPDKVLQVEKKRMSIGGISFNKNAKEYKAALLAYAQAVRTRDNKRCVICGSKDHINAHHLFYRSKYPELSLNTNNGVTLCHLHHREVHRLNS